MAAPDFDQAVEQYHLALSELMTGNTEPMQKLFSHQDGVCLANPFGPVVRGWKQVVETMERAASHYRDGGAKTFENIVTYVTPELAFIVEVERAKARVGGRQDITSIALRVTTIFRPEDGAWKVIHRHADPITSVRQIESVIQT